MQDNISLKSEWFFEQDGQRHGPFFNDFSPDGLTDVAELLAGLSSPYLVIGDDTAEGFVITEVFRKAVSAVTYDGPQVRFRTQLISTEGNGDHQKWCIYHQATDTPGTGRMLNLLRQLWSKAAGSTVLTIECRITVQQGVVA